MASDEMRLFGCPFCGFRVNPVDRECPRCGNVYTESTMFECPFCGEMVPSRARSCPECHVDYGEFGKKTERAGADASIDSLLIEIIRLEASQVKKENKRYSCPSCSWMLDGTEQTCPKCGVAFTNEVSFQCPICAALVDSDATRCPECGSAFVEEEAEPKRAETKVSTQIDEASTALTDILITVSKAGPGPQPPPTAPEAEEIEVKATSESTGAGAGQDLVEAKEATPPKKPRQRKLRAKPGKQTSR